MRFVGEIPRADFWSPRYLRTRANHDLDARIKRVHFSQNCKNGMVSNFTSINILSYILRGNMTNNVREI